MVGVPGSVIFPLRGEPSPPVLSLHKWGVCMPLSGDTLLPCWNLREGDGEPAHLSPTCLMAAGFLGPLSGELAAAESVCVTDMLAFELGGRGTSGIRAGSLGFQPPRETESRWTWGRDMGVRGEGTASWRPGQTYL